MMGEPDEGGPEMDLKEAMAAKGYEIISDEENSDDDPFPGRIPSIEPGLAREKGNKAFQEGKYDKAIRYWQGGLKNILSSLCSGPQALGNQSLSELDLTLNLNIAMAHMKKGDFQAAERSVEKALARRDALPPQQITKALYRKASAQKSMHRLEECMATLKELLEVEAGHPAAKQMLQEVEREWAKQCRDQKKHLKKLFCKLTEEDQEQKVQDHQRRAALRESCAVRWTEEDIDPAAFEQGDEPMAAGTDWGLAMCRTVLWAIDQLAVDGNFVVPAEQTEVSLWFLGASSTCELRWLQGVRLLARLPSVQRLRIHLIGFIGELDPDNKREPDPNLEKLPKEPFITNSDDGRQCEISAVVGSLEEALQKEPFVRAQSSSAPPTEVEAPTVCYIAHPQLHRYFSDFHPAISWLIQRKVPTIIIGASDPDPSWKQDEILLKALGADLCVSKRESPYPMCLPDNRRVRKCNHIIGFQGGKALEKDRLTKVKIELLTQDYNVR